MKSGYLERKVQRAMRPAGTGLKIDMTRWYEPTGENYFARISKTGIKQAITEAKGEDAALGVTGMSKADAVDLAERRIAGTGWLPNWCGSPPPQSRSANGWQ
ncbi:hypothetical protein [Shinella sp. HZN7]|uniref:hypothetical protein n=1 Tax=Shinella sp. (strain HZN7) TaxID=879274 RepID=UPI00143BB502|nr:hypothetical protein [Shinella sp. HZN7]